MNTLTSKVPSIWHNRDFVFLWVSQAVSLVGTQISHLAFPLLVLSLTNSPAQAGLIGSLRILPYVLLCLPVGALIDRWDRKKIMILCDIGRALALGSIPVSYFLGHLTVLQLYIVSLAEGVFFVFFDIAAVACLPRIVNKDNLPKATAAHQATIALSFLIGPALGGILFSIQPFLPFLVDTSSYIIATVLLVMIKTVFQEERQLSKRNLLLEIGEGLRWLWNHPLIRYVAILTGGSNFVWAGAPLVTIVLATELQASSFQIGLIFTSGGIGAIIGSIFAPYIQRRFRFGHILICALWMWVILWPLQLTAQNILTLSAIIAVSFAISPVYDVVQFSYRLSLIPDTLQGRVNSVFRLIAFGLQPLGLALAGVLLQVIGSTNTILILFIPHLILAFLTSINPHIRTAGVGTQVT